MLLPIDSARELLRHMEWADAQAWAAVLSGDATSTDMTLRGYLLHIHTVQQAFLAMWTNGSVEDVLKNRPPDDVSTLAMRDWARPYYDAARRFIDAADDRVFARTVVTPGMASYERQRGMTFTAPTLGETVFQVVNHTTHHRGQVLARIRAVGAPPPLTDYIAWVWFGKPAAAWDNPASIAAT